MHGMSWEVQVQTYLLQYRCCTYSSDSSTLFTQLVLRPSVPPTNTNTTVPHCLDCTFYAASAGAGTG